jgi:hypothetical protein
MFPLRTLRFCIFAFALFALAPLPAYARSQTDHQIHKIKSDILHLAKSYAGQGDADFSKQHALEKLVAKLLTAAPQPPIKDRLPLLYGTWHQVWGPYDYRNDNRGVDPELSADEIYQVISPNGYYYNVSPLYEYADHNRVRIGLLRGEYELSDDFPNGLDVHFTRYPAMRGRPTDDTPIWKLADAAEAGTLEHETFIVPRLIVWLFFGTGRLDEIYTDKDMRICYGSDGTPDGMKSIYIMTRATEKDASHGKI